MYPDPKKVKDNRYTFRLNDYEDAKLRNLAITLSEQPATLIRELLMAAVDAELAKLDTTIVSQSNPVWKSTTLSKLSAINWSLPCLNI